MFTEFKHYKIIYLPAFVLGYLWKWIFWKQLNLVYANLIWSVWKKHKETQWKAIYPANTCLFTHDRDSLFWANLTKNKDCCCCCCCSSFWERTAVRTGCVIIGLLVNLMNCQVSSLQRNHLAANLHWPFYRVRSNRRIPMNAFR